MTRVVFFGSPAPAAQTLRGLVEAGYDVAAVYTQPDRPAGRGMRLRPPPVKVRALIAHTNSGGEKRLRQLEMRMLQAGVTVTRTADDLARLAKCRWKLILR